jgi:hypothetical protein
MLAEGESQRTPWKPGWMLAALGVLALGIITLSLRLRDPSVHLLAREGGASWIRYPEPFSHVGRPKQQETALFRRTFTLDQHLSQATLVVRGFQVVVVQLDGNPVGPVPRKPEQWKDPVTIELAPLLKPGRHQLLFAALNFTGHACALANCQALDLVTDSSWEASRDGASWKPAVCLEAPEEPTLWQGIPTVGRGFESLSPWMIALFLAAVGWMLARARGHLRPFRCTPARLRWVLIAAWVVLAANNILKIPTAYGFDLSGHMDYVHYVAERGRLPLANEGWEMYQAPLYYVLTAFLDRGLGLLAGAPIERWLRLLPLACGAFQVELAYRTMRHACPDREDLQCVGIWVAGLLPANLYVSQVVGNEPLGAATAAVVALLCVKALCRPTEAKPMRDAVWIGLALGIALLSKMTAVVWIPLVGFAITAGTLASGRTLRTAAARTGVAWTIAALISGGYYARNWIELGKPLVGNWDWKEINRIWWQDPSYRIPEHLTRFGGSLVQPVYAAVHGFWDAMYSTMWCDGLLGGAMVPPPWNLDCMLAGAWLGLPITAAIVWAMVRVWRRSSAGMRAERFAVLAILLYVLVALDFYLRLPIYSSAKATYLLGLTPLFALLSARGLAPLLNRLGFRAAVFGFLLCFGVTSYAAYFVR